MNAKREAFLKDEIAALRRRAESAEANWIEGEKRVAELESALDDAQLLADERGVCLDQLEAELAQLREGEGWRPVTDDAPAPEEPHVIDTIRGIDLVRRDPDSRNIWHTVRGQRYYVDYEIRGWLKLPPSLKSDEEE